MEQMMETKFAELEQYRKENFEQIADEIVKHIKANQNAKE